MDNINLRSRRIHSYELSLVSLCSSCIDPKLRPTRTSCSPSNIDVIHQFIKAQQRTKTMIIDNLLNCHYLMSLYIEIAKKKMEELRSFPAKKGQPILRQISSKKIKTLTWSPTVPGIRYFLWESWRILPTSTSSEYSELSLIRPRWYRATPVLNPCRKSFETVVFASWENWKYPYFLHF